MVDNSVNISGWILYGSVISPSESHKLKLLLLGAGDCPRGYYKPDGITCVGKSLSNLH